MTTTVTPHGLIVDATPKEWESTAWDEAIQRRREAEDAQTKRLRALGVLPPWETEYATMREGQRYFLLRNTWRRKSRGTGRVETYYTLGGTERPFCGLDGIYELIRERVGNEADAVTEVFQALELGEIEPISRERAVGLYDRIYLATGYDIRPRQRQEVPR